MKHSLLIVTMGFTSFLFTAMGNANESHDNDLLKEHDVIHPIVRIQPKYPIQAARDGIEGFVTASFTINSIGGVENINILKSVPKDIFDTQAVRALKKWKFKPQVINGQALKRLNVRQTLTFKLD